MPQRYQRPYPPEFRREAVSLVKVSGRSINAVAGELGVSTESLRIWVRQDLLDRGERAVAAEDQPDETWQGTAYVAATTRTLALR
jgi:transposase